MPEVLLGLGPTIMEIKGKFIDIIKVKKLKSSQHYKVFTTLQVFFKEFRYALSNSPLLFIQLKTDLYI